MRRVVLLWTHCPSCDAPLPSPVAIGEDWECTECGAYGTRRLGKYDTVPLPPLFHEQANPPSSSSANDDDDIPY